MSTTVEIIRSKIEQIPPGCIFTKDDFITKEMTKEVIAKALIRIAMLGEIERFSKSKYYKPKKTIFGNLKPNEDQVIKDLLERDGKMIGYRTGIELFNRLGLTTQISAVIQIGSNKTRSRHKRGHLTIAFVSQKNRISKETIPLLQILDAIRFVNIIPDRSDVQVCKRFLAIMKSLSEQDKALIVELSLQYSPATRAVLGCLLEELESIRHSEALRKTLNPVTTYRFLGIFKSVSIAKNWNIR